ncbi:MAG: hypothetical protein ACR2JA_09235 [Hydrogenophaga sp.]|uniref:hypothetical protein n=1 Tax=Hydrogenophaga sp. TaxID=1904254 RepID=UPI003D9B99F9
MPTFAAALPPRRPPAFLAWVCALLALWLVALLLGPALLAASGLALNPHGHAHLYAHGHPFVDARVLWSIPNAMDVLSNAPLSLAGLLGLLALRGRGLPGATRAALVVFFTGLLVTGFGSALYHWSPDAAGLVADRLGMAVTFAGALALAVAERVGQAPARPVLVVAFMVAVLSAALPYTHGNVLPWAVVQFGGVALIAWAALQAPAPGAIGVHLGALIAWYALAKALELGDAAVFHATSGWISGHSLKHLGAALAAWPVLAALLAQPLRQNAAGSGAARA